LSDDRESMSARGFAPGSLRSTREYGPQRLPDLIMRS